MNRLMPVVASLLTLVAASAAAPAQAAVRPHPDLHQHSTGRRPHVRSAPSAALPGAATRAAIVRAAAHTDLLGDVPPSDVVVSRVVVSHDGRWASALDTPEDGRTDPAQVLLEKVGHRWVARDLGTEGVGCGLVPASRRAQLRLVGAC